MVLLAGGQLRGVHGAFQFVLITFLSSGASLVTVALTALLMNSRQSFYALTFLNDFKRMGRRRLYMIHTLTDETYAVNCTLDDIPEGSGRTRCSSWRCCAGFTG